MPDKSTQIRNLEKALDCTFEHLRDPIAYFNDPEVYPDSYTKVMSWQEEMVRDMHGRTLWLDQDEHILGINLYGHEVSETALKYLLELDLPHLLALNLNKTGIRSFHFSSRMSKLMYINLSQNKELAQISFEHSPSDLIILDAYDSAVEELSIPSGMDKLQRLDLSRNALKKIVFETACKELLLLYLGDNQLAEIHFPAGFAKLWRVSFFKNQLKSFSFDGRLPELRSLDFRNNQMTELPQNFLSGIPDLEELYLYNNPWNEIKDFVAGGERDNSRTNVYSYLESIQDKSKVRNLYEAKMILVGNGMVGKTSIRKKLLDRNAALPSIQDRTQCLEIAKYPIVVQNTDGSQDKINFTLNIWDFGGQGYYREIQHLFCSHQSLYLFVTSHDDQPNNENYVGFDYWLNMAAAYGFDKKSGKYSPIVLLVNKIDQKDKFISAAEFAKSFPGIHPQVLHLSAFTLENFHHLEELIPKLIPQIGEDVFQVVRNQNWLEVKDELEARISENYISYDEYKSICSRHSMNADDANAWLNNLGRIGTVVYSSDTKLKDWVILNPEWLRRALYSALDHDLLRNNGILTQNKIDFVWSGYKPDERKHFLQLMIAFELAYKRINIQGNTEYVVPSCLPERSPIVPAHLKVQSYESKIVYKPFVPAGTVSKLIVNVHTQDMAMRMQGGLEVHKHGNIKVYDGLMWKDNVILQDADRNTYAHICEDWEHKQVFIRLFGRDVARLFDYVHEILSRLRDDLYNTQYIRELHLEPMIKDTRYWISAEMARQRQLAFYSMEHITKEKVIGLATSGKILAAADLLQKELPGNAQTIINLKGRWNYLQTQVAEGTVRGDDANVERNQIRAAIVQLAQDLPSTSSGTQKPSENISDTSATKPETDKKVYFSYAWGDDEEEGESREDIVNQIYDDLSQEFALFRDKENLEYGGSITEFMEKLAKGDLVVIFISDKYIKSPFCMFELYMIAQNSSWSYEEFRQKVLTVRVESLALSKPSVMMKYFKHWNEQEKEWEDFVKQMTDQITVENQKRYENVRNIQQKIGKLTDWLADMNASSKKLLTENDSERIKKAIRDRLNQ